jgi:putative membrane protein
MFDLQDLPTLNASLNASAGVLLFLGRRAIKAGKPALHKKLMLTAFGVSAVFLVSYLTYHYATGHTEYGGTGWLKGLYLAILLPHILLATLMVPFIIAALITALRGKFELHKKLVRWVWPVWMYVSVTGVLVYLMLYVLPQG